MTKKPFDLAQFLNQQHLCESLTIKEVQTLLDYTELVEYKKGDVITDIGEVGDAIYFVVSGEMALVYEERGSEMEIGRMKEGELVGEMSFFDRQPRMLRMRVASDDTQLMKLSRVMYDRLRIEHPYLAVVFLEHAIISLDHLVRRVSDNEMSLNRYVYGRGGKR